MIKKMLLKRRNIILALLLIILAGAFSVFNIVSGIINSENRDERLKAQDKVKQVLQSSELIAEEYVRRRELEIENAQEVLDREAATLVGEVQVFLLGAIIKREADISQDNLKEVKKKRELLAAFALQRFSSMTKEMLRLKQDVTRMQISLDDLIEEAQKKIGSDDLGLSLIGSDTAAADNNFPQILDEIKKKNIQNSKTFREKGGAAAKNEVVKLKELRKYLDDNAAQSQIDPVNLFNEISPDIATILPKGSILTISEAGGRVLLSLGGESDGTGKINSEVSRSMIFKVMDQSYQMLLSLSLHEDTPVEAANLVELSGILQAHVLRTVGESNYSGYIFDDDGELVKVFPESAGMRTSIPTLGWKELKSADVSTYYSQKKMELGGISLSMGICYEMRHVHAGERIERIISDNPVNAVLMIVVVVIIFIALVVLGIMGWQGSSRTIAAGAGRTVASDIDIRSIRPELGSLKRLQKMNRGHSVGGSRILDYSRNEALKELVARVRSDNSESTRRKPEKSESEKTLPGLREYMK